MIRKVGYYIFVKPAGRVKGDAQVVNIVCCTIFVMTDLGANVPGTSLESSQEHILGSLIFHWTYKCIIFSYLLLEYKHIEPASMFQSVSLVTIERTFGVLRQSIYDEAP